MIDRNRASAETKSHKKCQEWFVASAITANKTRPEHDHVRRDAINCRSSREAAAAPRAGAHPELEAGEEVQLTVRRRRVGALAKRRRRHRQQRWTTTKARR